MKWISVFFRYVHWIILASLIWACVFSFDLLPILRGGFGWQWQYLPARGLRNDAPLIVGVIVYILGAALLFRRKAANALLCWAIAGSIGLALAAVYIRDNAVLDRLYALTISGWTGGWHMAAARITNLNATLRNWPQFMVASSSFSHHMGHATPGIVLMYYEAGAWLGNFPALAAFLASPLRWLQCEYLLGYSDGQYASTWLGMLMPVWSSLTVLPLYFIGRRIFGEQAARWSVAWWPIIPSILIFTPLPDTFYALPSLVMIGLLLEGLRGNKPTWILASGALMSVMTFFSLTFVPLLLLAGLLTLGFYWIRRMNDPSNAPPWYQPVLVGLWYGLGLSLAWILYFLISGVGFWQILAAAGQEHLALDRPYAPWLILHLNDFFMFTGWPLSLLAGIGVWSILRKIRSGKPLAEVDIVILASALTMLLLDLSGTLRGETGRILAFLSPWLLFAAAHQLQGNFKLGSILTVTQGLMVIAVILCLDVVNSEFPEQPPVPPAIASAPAPGAHLIPNGSLFGGAALLDSVSGKIETAPNANGRQRPTLALWMNWQARQPINASYELSFLPIDPAGQTAPTATVVAPFQGRYPTSCWRPGTAMLQDQVQVPLFVEQPGPWQVRFELIDAKTGKPVELVNSGGEPAYDITLGPFK